jgi:hypothetical protein
MQHTSIDVCSYAILPTIVSHGAPTRAGGSLPLSRSALVPHITAESATTFAMSATRFEIGCKAGDALDAPGKKTWNPIAMQYGAMPEGGPSHRKNKGGKRSVQASEWIGGAA